jgi:tetratricopeptide (TPR) repeat protein
MQILRNATVVAADMLLVSTPAAGVPMEVPKGEQRLAPTPSWTEEAFRLQPQGMRQDDPLHAALQAINAGRPREAITILREHLKTRPPTAPARELLGAALALDGKLDEALGELRAAVALNPGQSTAYTKMADILMAQGKRDAALPLLRKAIEISPQDRLPHQRLGLLYEAMGKPADAVRQYELGIAGTRPEYLGIKLNLARLYNASGQYARTRELLDGPAGASNADALVLLGTAYLALGGTDDALARFEAARKRDPKEPGAYLGLGIARRSKADYAGSIEALNELLRLRPDWSMAHYQLGETYFARKQHKEALARFQQAAKLDP